MNRWGFKGRFDEETASAAPNDIDRLNEEARTLYYQEDCQIIESLNRLVPDGKPKLRAPDPKFNRQIGEGAGKTYSIDGRLLTDTEYKEHLQKVLPGPQDFKDLDPLFRAGNWMAAGSA